MTHAMCPACGARGRAVGEITIRSLVREDVRAELREPAGFSFCVSPGREVAYFSADGRTVDAGAVNVRIGVTQRERPRLLCYCFDYTAEQIEADARAGSTAVVDAITAKCRAGWIAARRRTREARFASGRATRRHVGGRSGSRRGRCRRRAP